MDQSNTTNKKGLAIIGLLVIVAVIAVGVVATDGKKKPVATTAATTPAATATPTTTPAPISASGYKDGTYSATSSYDNPGGDSALGVSITLKNGIITGSTVTAEATDDESKEYQELFVSGYKNLIIGKPVGSVSLSQVSGSSLTSQGFNAALNQIKAKAKA